MEEEGEVIRHNCGYAVGFVTEVVQFVTYLNINDRELKRKKQHECVVKFKKRASS